MYFLEKYKRGIFNRYYKNMPVSEIILKDLSHLYLKWRHYFKNGFKNKELLVYPHYPSRGSTMYKIANHLGYVVTNKPSPRQNVAVYWEYLTIRKEFELLEKLSARMPVVNLHSRDISKAKVDSIFNSVFGYSTFVDPLTFEGEIVQKSDDNGMHDGMVLQAPITEKKPGQIYQILIDNTHGIDRVMDIRATVVGGLLDFVYLKYRNISNRFKYIADAEVKPRQEILSEEETRKLNALCKAMNLEFGELDILRNKNDGKIYVIDVNNTPQGPPTDLDKQTTQRVLDTLSSAFVRKFVDSTDL